MLLDDMADYLSSAASTAWVAGTNLFTGTMPAKPDICVTIMETGGSPTIHAMGNFAGRAKVENPTIQVVTRAAAEDYATARTNANTAFLALDGFPKRTINGCEYLWGAAAQSPFLMGRDDEERVLVAFNVELVKRLSTA